jgi:hypothetical protein
VLSGRRFLEELGRCLLDGRASSLKVHHREEAHHGEVGNLSLVGSLSWAESLSEVEIHLLLHRASRHLRRCDPHLCEVEIPYEEENLSWGANLS